MTTPSNDRRIFLGMPGYGRQTEAAGCAFWNATRSRFVQRARGEQIDVNEYRKGSLLASNFNQLWCSGLNTVHQGKRLDYWAMLHDDVGPMECGPERYWLDLLIDELEERELDVLAVAVPIKDSRGITSMALHREGDNWLPLGRLSMHDVYRLPGTFTSDDLGVPLLLNTGCWVVKWNQEWCRRVHFEINDRIVFNRAANKYQAQTEPEDWFFSRLCHEEGLKIGATTKIPVYHRGEYDFANTRPWGSSVYDVESCKRSPVPDIDREGFRYPHDVPGWLRYDEGKALWRLAEGKRVLEIGSYCGRSTICLAQSAAHVTSVDPHDGRGTPEQQPTLETFQKCLDRYGVTENVTSHVGTFADCLDVLEGSYDFIFVDGAHDYPAVKSDIDIALRLLAPGGLLAFHDYRSPQDPGVTKAVDELLASGADLLSTHDLLAVVRPPAAIPLEV